MVRVIASCLITAVLLTIFYATAAGYFLGNYLVEFGLARQKNEPPQAYALIMPEDFRTFDEPEYERENWQITSRDNLLMDATHFFPDEEGHNWAIVVHGYGCTQQNSWYIADTYLAWGYNVLTPDLRASGDSEGKYLTLGYKESWDVSAWAEEIGRRDPKAKIVLHGVSMGATSVMLAAAAPDLEPRVVACIEDCGYTSAYHLLALKLEESFSLPSFPAMNFLDWRCRRRADFSLHQADPLSVMHRIKIPILFIQGAKDIIVPPYMVDLLFDACQSPVKDIFIAENSLHGVGCQMDREAYYQKVQNFLEPLMR